MPQTFCRHHKVGLRPFWNFVSWGQGKVQTACVTITYQSSMGTVILCLSSQDGKLGVRAQQRPAAARLGEVSTPGLDPLDLAKRIWRLTQLEYVGSGAQGEGR